jgi:hypothetical protein
MKVICIDDSNFKASKYKPIKGKVYEGSVCRYGSDYFRWKIVDHPGMIYFDYRFKEFKCNVPNNVKVI